MYGIDLEEPGLMGRRTWRWLRIRILGLLSTESRLHREKYPPKKERIG